VRNGVIVDGELDGPFPPAPGFDGKSYDYALFCDDAVFFPPGTELPGSYFWRSVLRDREGNGWNIETPFEVVSGVTGDFNKNGTLDEPDITLLSDAVNVGADLSFDLSKNGKLDQEDRRIWVEDLKLTYFGDSNFDGEFNSGDFVVVFQLGEYEDSVEDNSTWADGDWNGDRDFESGDFVSSFQAAGYEKGPRPAAQAVPEPTSFVPIAIAVGIVAAIRPSTMANRETAARFG
jgi:hypothetical protein